MATWTTCRLTLRLLYYNGITRGNHLEQYTFSFFIPNGFSPSTRRMNEETVNRAMYFVLWFPAYRYTEATEQIGQRLHILIIVHVSCLYNDSAICIKRI